jgi:hypothetical protein
MAAIQNCESQDSALYPVSWKNKQSSQTKQTQANPPSHRSPMTVTTGRTRGKARRTLISQLLRRR